MTILLAIHVEQARQLALEAHGNQTYGPYPYIKHLEDVQHVLERFGYDSVPLCIAAWLHDVLEDTAVTYDVLTHSFSPDIADTVWRVTDEEGTNRTERKAKTYPKIKGHDYATIIKLCDRIANVEACLEGHPQKLTMYAQEHPAFKRGIYSPAIAEPLWNYLDKILEHA